MSHNITVSNSQDHVNSGFKASVQAESDAIPSSSRPKDPEFNYGALVTVKDADGDYWVELDDDKFALLTFGNNEVNSGVFSGRRKVETHSFDHVQSIWGIDPGPERPTPWAPGDLIIWVTDTLTVIYVRQLDDSWTRASSAGSAQKDESTDSDIDHLLTQDDRYTVVRRGGKPVSV